jgi:ABC-type nitrate/sulfonate/bicarbonate transport system ATPase subunit
MENVAFAYGGDATRRRRLFEDFSLTLDRDAGVTVFLGASGTGKSTLLALLGGVLTPDAGAVRYEGFNSNGRLPAVGFVFQSAALVPWKTIKANVLFGAEIIGDGAIRSAAEDARALMGKYGLGGYEARYPHELSGGMQQRASIIRAIVSGARILLLDEPFSNSDFVTRRALQNEISDLIEERDLLVALVTHDLDDALRFGDRIVVVGDRPLRVLDSFAIQLPRRSRLNGRGSAAPQLTPYLERVWRALEHDQRHLWQ